MSYSIRPQAGKGPQPRHVDGETFRAKHTSIFKPKPRTGRMCPECDSGILNPELVCPSCGRVFEKEVPGE